MTLVIIPIIIALLMIILRNKITSYYSIEGNTHQDAVNRNHPSSTNPFPNAQIFPRRDFPVLNTAASSSSSSSSRAGCCPQSVLCCKLCCRCQRLLIMFIFMLIFIFMLLLLLLISLFFFYAKCIHIVNSLAPIINYLNANLRNYY